MADGQTGRYHDAVDSVGIFGSRARGGLGDGGQDGAGRGLDGCGPIFTEAVDHRRSKDVDRFVGVWAAGGQTQTILMANVEAHDAADAFGVGFFISLVEANVGVETARETGQYGRGPEMQAAGVGYGDHFGVNGLVDAFGGECGIVDRRQLHQHIFAGLDISGGFVEFSDAIAVADEDQGEQAGGVGGDIIGIEFDQGITGFYEVADLDV